ncbi:hypothetical protein L1765_10165 [Microaerobacter geothermalis]|uniref:hypothetical protein n=1 Tax=Microaerobacter geothermalis TaxID=674972 RepID=UPI001F27DDBD|nr:hypothetical protein [Microaerobacter geothermalis]MCF6094327.1 hypothetical protein [Microaerobacter geothermalis]
MNLEKAFNIAELKAKTREQNKGVDLETVNKEADKAEKAGYILVKRNEYNKARHSILNNVNMIHLLKSKYLTVAEGYLLLSIANLLRYDSNIIVDDNNVPMSVSDIAELFGKSREQTSRNVNQLIKKGIIHQYADPEETLTFGRVVSERILILNPELVYAGDRNKINHAMSVIAIQRDKLEKNKIYLPWKIWIKPKANYGQLYQRKTYLKLKKMIPIKGDV